MSRHFCSRTMTHPTIAIRSDPFLCSVSRCARTPLHNTRAKPLPLTFDLVTRFPTYADRPRMIEGDGEPPVSLASCPPVSGICFGVCLTIKDAGLYVILVEQTMSIGSFLFARHLHKASEQFRAIRIVRITYSRTG